MNIRELLERQAEKYSNHTFLLFQEQKITYADFNGKVNRVANGFRRLGVKKGDMVALMLPNSPAFFYSWMGLNKIGAVEVPINTSFKQAEISYILGHSESVGMVVHEDCRETFEKISKDSLPKLGFVIVCEGSGSFPGAIPFSAMLEEKEELEHVHIPEEHPAACIYTSGTTDRSKGVLNSHRSWVLTGESYAFTVGITHEDRVMTPNPLFHANAQVYSTMGALAAGATLILLERFSASRILEQAREYRATKMVLVQAVTPWVWNRPRQDDDRDNPVNTMVAGNVSREIYYEFEERFQLKIQTIYSLTESVMAIMGPREGTQKRKPGGIGVPMEHPSPDVRNDVRIVDSEGAEVRMGERGEIAIRNPAVMNEYFKDPVRTAETKRDGWIFTGDMGYQDEEGYFFFVGRKKEVIRRRGELVSPSEVESVIAAQPSVLEVAVVGVASGLGTGEEEIKAYVRLKEGERVEPAELFSLCRERLAEFKIPRYLVFREDFPRSAIGRIQKNVLKEDGSTGTHCYDRLQMEKSR